MTEEEISRAFPQIMHKMGKLSVDAVIGRDMTQNEFIALNILHDYKKENKESQGIYVSTLSAVMRTSVSGISRMLRVMEDRGLIERSVDREDRRNTFVSITDQGESLRTEGMERVEKIFHTVSVRLGLDKVDYLIGLLTDFVEIMQEETEKLKQQKGVKTEYVQDH